MARIWGSLCQRHPKSPSWHYLHRLQPRYLRLHPSGFHTLKLQLNLKKTKPWHRLSTLECSWRCLCFLGSASNTIITICVPGIMAFFLDVASCAAWIGDSSRVRLRPPPSRCGPSRAVLRGLGTAAEVQDGLRNRRCVSPGITLLSVGSAWAWGTH